MQHQYCLTPSPNWQAFRRAFDTQYFQKAQNAETDETLYIGTRYVVIYSKVEEQPSITQIRAAHRVLNDTFSGQNRADLDRVPNVAMYPWAPLIGTPNIRFLPLDPANLQVEYMFHPSALETASPVTNAALIAGVSVNVLNIYIGTTSGGNILGQAELSSNIVYCLNTTIGGADFPGSLQGYAFGKTLVHEVGHALSLPHTFADDACDNNVLFPDIPEQINPNFNTVLIVDESTGQPSCSGDNRFEDRKNPNGTRRSCLHVVENPQEAPNEMGINFMDYGGDDVSLMFSKSQALMMRTYLKSPFNTTLSLVSPDASGVVAIPPPQPLPPFIELTDPATGTVFSNINLTGMVLGMLVFVALVACLIWLLVRRMIRKKKVEQFGAKN